MTDDPKPPEADQKLPGTPVAEFAVAVTAFEQVRNEDGAFSLFLGRDSVVRVIGEVQKFAGRVRALLPDFDQDAVDTAVEEIRQFVQLLLFSYAPDRAARLMVSSHVPSSTASDEKKAAPYLSHYRRKIELCQRLVTPGLRERANRLASTLAPILEDVDIDVVSERHSQVDNRTVLAPFLRVGIRYSEPAKDRDTPWFYPPLSKPRSDLKEFTLECDAADLDLLIARLYRAKELLAQAITGKAGSALSKETTL